MAQAPQTYERVLELVHRLDLVEQERLLHELLALIEGQRPRERSILELDGLGAELWREIDVDEYLRRERESWYTTR